MSERGPERASLGVLPDTITRPHSAMYSQTFRVFSIHTFHLGREICQRRTHGHGNTARSSPLIGPPQCTTTTMKHHQASCERKQCYHVKASFASIYLALDKITLNIVVGCINKHCAA